ncbi:MAG TPA: VOC family protein [Rhizomicrobium sp.]|nr:VOC family protein [Rhizomicrobium sp.]
MEQIIANLLNDFERGRMSRRQLVQTLAAGIAAATTTPALAAGPTKLKAISVNHYVLAVPDYAKTRDFYADLLGMTVSEDTGKQCYLGLGDTLLTARTNPQPGVKPYITHVGYTLDDWNADAVESELKRRGLEPRTDMGGGAKSFHIKDLDGYDVQVGPPLKKA